MMLSDWAVGNVSSFKAMEILTMNPISERHLSVGGFPEQKRM